jgi:hypothetical protein
MLAYWRTERPFGCGSDGMSADWDLLPDRRIRRRSTAASASEEHGNLDLVRIGADGSPHWLRVWPAPEENPRHARLELCMAVPGCRIVSRPASWFDWCQDQGG